DDPGSRVIARNATSPLPALALDARRILALHEPIQPFPLADHAIPLARDALEGGGVVLEGVGAGAEVFDLGADNFQLAGLLLALPFQPPDVEEIVLAAEDGEVGGGDDDGGEEEVAASHSAFR